MAMPGRVLCKHVAPRAHTPLLEQVRDITDKLGSKIRKSPFIFPNDRTGKRLSPNVLLEAHEASRHHAARIAFMLPRLGERGNVFS
jgi:hypothetical protein